MDDSTHQNPGEELGELLESLRWTEQLSRRLVGDSALAADVHQDTWTRALELFGDAVPGRDWLAGTLRSMAYRARRSQRRRRAHEAQGRGAGEAAAADEVIERSEARQRVAAATARLPRDMRAVLLLRFQEGLSLAAVASELGCSKSTAGERVQRSLVALRKELEAESGGWRACCVLAVPLGAAPVLPLPWAKSLSSSTKPASAALAPGSAPVSAGTSLTVPLVGVAMKKLLLVAAVLIAAIAVTVDRRAAPLQEQALPTAGGPEVPPLIAPNAPEVQVAALESDPPSRTVAEAKKAAAPEATLDPASIFVFKARVVDSGGSPVAGARLWTQWRKPLHAATATCDGEVELTLDQSDLDELPDRGLYVKVGAGPYLALWSQYINGNGTSSLAPPRLGAVEDLGTITLGPAGAVEGRALSTSGQPIAGATIDVHAYDENDPDRRLGYRGVEPDVVTDADGRFLAGHLLRGSATLSIRHPDFMSDAPLTLVEVTEGVTGGPVTLRATAASIVTGRVIGPKGEPIAGAYVNGTGNWSVTDTAETDSEGRFRVGLRDGAPAPIECHLPGWRQVQPGKDVPQTAGEIEILMEPVSAEPSAAAAAAETEAASSKPGVSGRLLRNGKPLSGARVLLHSVSLQLASPREHLEGARAVRTETASVDVKKLTGRGGYSPISTLGLDGVPPAYRLLPGNSRHGTITDEEGRFLFEDVELPSAALVLRLPGAKLRTLGRYQLEEGALEIGDVEVRAAATLVGQVESTWPWDPSSYVVRTKDPDLKVPLDGSGGFVLQDLEPGPAYFTLARKERGDDAEGDDDFENVPTFHVDLAPGATRSVAVNLDPYAPSAIDLEVTLGGSAPLGNCLLYVTPVDEPDRQFRLFCDVEGSSITSRTRALGPCHLSFTQASGKGGFTQFRLPGGPLDLRPGETARRKVDIPAGRIALTLPAGHPARSFEQLDLVLDGAGTPTRVGGIGPHDAEDDADHAANPIVLTTVSIPAGSYTARLQPGRWTHQAEAGTDISTFEVTVVSGETAQVTPPF